MKRAGSRESTLFNLGERAKSHLAAAFGLLHRLFVIPSAAGRDSGGARYRKRLGGVSLIASAALRKSTDRGVISPSLGRTRPRSSRVFSQKFEFLFGQLFSFDQIIASVPRMQNQLIEFCLNRDRVAILRML